LIELYRQLAKDVGGVIGATGGCKIAALNGAAAAVRWRLLQQRRRQMAGQFASRLKKRSHPIDPFTESHYNLHQELRRNEENYAAIWSVELQLGPAEGTPA
jgi:hypothetical protein